MPRPRPSHPGPSPRTLRTDPAAKVVGVPRAPRFVHADVLWAVAIFAVALIVRLWVLHQSRSSPLFDKLIVDAQSYWDWAGAIAAGDWAGKETFYQAPLYPYVLGVLRAAGAGLMAVKVAQCICGAVSCVILFMAARAWFGSRAIGAAAGFMLALYAPAIFFDTIIQKAGAGLLFTVLLLWLLGRAWNAGAARARAWWSLAAGFSLGLLMLTREETILLAPVALLVAGAAAWRAPGTAARPARLRASVLCGAALLMGVVLPLLPVVARNHRVGGEWVLTTSQAGPNFYIGNNPDATGRYASLRPGRGTPKYERRDAFELAEIAAGRALTPSEVSRYWTGRAFDFIRTNPGAWLRLMGRKALMLVNDFEIPDGESQYFTQRFSPLLDGLAAIGRFGVLVPLAALGMALTASRWRALWPLYMLIGAMCAAVVLFYVFARYRYPLVPALMPFGAAGLVLFVPAVRARRWGVLGAGVFLCAGMAVVGNIRLADPNRELAPVYYNAGITAAEAGDDATAIRFYTEAQRLEPTLASVPSALAESLARSGRKLEAMQSISRAYQLSPDDPAINFRIGTLLAEFGQTKPAIEHLRRAVELLPSDIEAATNLSIVLLRERQWSAAAAHLRASVTRFPNDPSFAASLAWLLATCPDESVRSGSEAVAQARRAIALAPQPSADLQDILGAALAETGDFAGAAQAAQSAITLASLAPPGGQIEAGLIAGMQARLALYQSGKPFHEH